MKTHNVYITVTKKLVSHSKIRTFLHMESVYGTNNLFEINVAFMIWKFFKNKVTGVFQKRKNISVHEHSVLHKEFMCLTIFHDLIPWVEQFWNRVDFCVWISCAEQIFTHGLYAQSWFPHMESLRGSIQAFEYLQE